ncbi:Outer membrane protein (porin) [Succinivibrio dextrinosolvens]|uniref:porin n=1 Tax=Succinivibrio dextrinosolvens TaxID=83771 RepID=UPI0008F13CE8|nr:porin [Succinivibrio dextrinosolvens]SFS79802.1 Outer membrane protein (porin) [Succinivibrio dextrinosolvens]
MKLIPLAAALSVILTSQAQAATVYEKDGTNLDLFGRINAMYLSDSASRHVKGSKNINKNSSDPAIQTTVYFGVAGRSQLSDNVYAIGYTEWLMPTGSNGDNSISARAQYVGIDAQQYGTLTFGRGDNAFYTVAGVTDIYQELDCQVNDHYAFGDYQPGLIMYSLSALGWDFRLSYQTAQDNVNNTNINIHNGASFAVATRLDNGIGIAYGVSYYYLQPDNNQVMAKEFSPHIQKMYNLGSSEWDLYAAYALRPTYKIDKGVSITYGTFGEGLYAAINGTVTKYNKYTHNLYSYEAVINYSFENGFSTTLGYGMKRFDGANIISDLTLGLYYKFNPNFKVFAEASFDVSSKPDRFYSNAQISRMALDRNKGLIGAEYAF